MKNPSILSEFCLATFSDLKKYKFYYWFGFPALLPISPFTLDSAKTVSEVAFCEKEKLCAAYNEFSLANPSYRAYFLVKRDALNKSVSFLPLTDLPNVEATEIIFGFADPSSQPQNPGWPLRNFLLLIQSITKAVKIQVLCYRGASDVESIILNVDMPEILTDIGIPKCVGWEKNMNGKLAPRLADLAPLMDPHVLAETAVDLNLKLMRWRIVPELDLEKVGGTKCLLLGAGTLGCYTARGLMAWGVKHITFVDNGRVSFSNPVRQPLYAFEDCINGGQPKAEAAAKELHRIYPGVNASGHSITIPMPGHFIESSAATSSQIDQIEALIKSHDAIFLLTDSREARWLPSILAAFHGKIVINCALGFDTFVVMRHGMRSSPIKSRLGCYFCNDVVAPADSMRQRSLDQQCTVTRPGLSGITSGLAVELLASIQNHHLGYCSLIQAMCSR